MSELQLLILFIFGLAAIVYFAWSIHKAPCKCDRCPFDCAHCPWDDRQFSETIFNQYIDRVREKSNDGARL